MAAMLITLFVLVLMVVLALWGIGVLLIPIYLRTLSSDWSARHEVAEALDEALDEPDARHEGGESKGKGRA